MRTIGRFFVLCAVVLAGCVDAPTAVHPAGADLSVAGSRRSVPITVMSRNLYLGADLAPLFELREQSQIPFAVAALWADAVANDFPTRAGAIAEEIAATEPQLIGLQEVAYYRLNASGSTLVVLDYLDVLLDALQARGLNYRVAARVDNIDLTFPIFLPPATLGSINYVQRDVILARADVQTSNPASGNYSARLPLESAGVPIVIPRGWTAVDATRHGITVRFVNTHLEAFHAYFNGLQAHELAKILAGEAKSVVLVGDINSGPGDPANRPAYGILRNAGFQDAWVRANPGSAGFTCCFADLLSDLTRTPDQRIDVVFFRQPTDGSTGVDHVSAAMVGGRPGDRVWSDVAGALIWPSDHIGVVATLQYRTPRPVGPPPNPRR
jgi:endonuclease/exonuclease/phosphatase family metal-dependent hydrolase